MSSIINRTFKLFNNKKYKILNVSTFNAAMFAQWLRKRRESLIPKMSATSFAQEIGVSKSYISLLEKGDDHDLTNKPVQPALDKVEKMGKILKCDTNEARMAAGYEPFENNSGLMITEIQNYLSGSDFWDEEQRKYVLEFIRIFIKGIKLQKESENTKQEKRVYAPPGLKEETEKNLREEFPELFHQKSEENAA